MERQYSGRRKEFDKFAYQESPRNEEIEAQARKEGKSIQVINYRKLIYAGNFSFIARRAP